MQVIVPFCGNLRKKTVNDEQVPSKQFSQKSQSKDLQAISIDDVPADSQLHFFC